MLYVVKCAKCGTEYNAKGEADYESVGDGGPACCTGVQLDEAECPQCGSGEGEIIGDVDEDPIDF